MARNHTPPRSRIRSTRRSAGSSKVCDRGSAAARGNLTEGENRIQSFLDSGAVLVSEKFEATKRPPPPRFPRACRGTISGVESVESYAFTRGHVRPPFQPRTAGTLPRYRVAAGQEPLDLGL